MAIIPLGYVVGTLAIGRLVAPSTRLRLVRPLAVMTPLALIPALSDPPFPVVVVIGLVAGFGNAVLMPLNGLFVQVLPNAYRARAFGIMQGGMQVLHATAVLATGALSEVFPVPVVVGTWSAVGLILIAIAAHRWPNQDVIQNGITHARQLNSRPAEATDDMPRPTRAAKPASRTTSRRGGGPVDDTAAGTAPARL
jgi:MFS family permease